jgi:hypothetical protein
MKPRCEIMAKKVLPAIRVAMVKVLVEDHGMTQSEAARRLGITQPAVSQYLSRARGSNYQQVLKSLDLSPLIAEISEKLVSGELRNEGFSKIYCMICSRLSSAVFEE